MSSTTQQQQPPAQPPQLTVNRGIVKQVLSGDTVIIRGQPKGGPPPEKTISLTHINARKLARRPNPNVEVSGETKDEPYAWDAREFLRKKLVGKEIVFVVDYKVPTSGREYGCIYLGKDTSGENIGELLVSEGLVEVRHVGKSSEELQRLCDLEDLAKAASKGIWSEDTSKHVRNIKWNIDNPRDFVESLHNKPTKAVIEHVRDGSTVRAFLLPDFQYVTVMMSGIRTPVFKVSGDDGLGQQGEAYAAEAKYFTESRLLQRDVEIVLESVSNANFFGTIIHPCGNIAELLLREGFARCVDWSISFVTSDVDKLRAAEKHAKASKLRMWKGYVPSGPQVDAKDKEFTAKVVEIVNADSLVVKTNGGTLKKIFLASIRPPRLQDTDTPEPAKDTKARQFRPLYDVPFMYEAREFLRQKLIGKKVNVVVDYLQPPSNSFPERTCCTVTIGGANVAEELVSKGLATVVRYRQDDDRRSSRYDDLLAAESKAQKGRCGMHNKNKIPIHRVADISGDSPKAKQFLPFLQRAGRTDAVVEYVSSGSRLRLYVPKETCLITLLLAGISCPRGSRLAPGGGGGVVEGEPFGEEALAFTKDLCMQREVEVEVESMDKAGNFIGWLWIEGTNLSIALVAAGLAAVHTTAERSSHYKALLDAEQAAKKRKDKIWKGWEEQKEDDESKDDVSERKVEHVSVVVTEVSPDLKFYAQHTKNGPQLEELMEQLREAFSSNPPVCGSYMPKKGDLCAARFVDKQWYRAKVERVSSDTAAVFYVDYGNREVTKLTDLAQLPGTFHGAEHAAHEYGLACVQLSKDADYQQEAIHAFAEETLDRTLLLNVEYKVGNVQYVTLTNEKTKEDVGKSLIANGLLILDPRKEHRLQQLVSEYRNAQEAAKKNRLNMWVYGDFLEDDAKEFGYQKN